MDTNKRLTISGILIFASILSGDFLMLVVAGLARQLTDGLLLQWLIATGIIAIGSFILMGIPEITAWSKPSSEVKANKEHTDPRIKMALRYIEKESRGHFVIASLLGGPLLIGFVTGRENDPRAFQKTFAASLIMAAAWSAIYVGVIEAITKSVERFIG